jgi:subtilisin-like proprotein convertase family protein
MRRLGLLAALAALVLPAAAAAASFTNATPIAINDNGAASPYPSAITPAGLLGTVTKVTVSLNGVTHAFLGDIDALLVGPNGSAVVLMSDSCSTQQGSSITFTFDDAATDAIPGGVCAIVPSYRPFNNLADSLGFGCGTDPDVFPAPAPAGPLSGGYPTGPQTLSVFNGMTAAVAMGAWNLYVADDCQDFTGAINGGWTLDITTQLTAVTVLAFTARALPAGVRLSWRTASQIGIAGFNVFRGDAKVNRSLIPASHGFGGAYSVVDRSTRAGRAAYRLQVVNLDGSRRWAASARLSS